MKFLHTADWHLGVKTNGRDRLPEQKRVLEEILSIANFESVDCVIIAGDIFNSANPSAEAEELFFETIEKLSAGGDRFVFVLAGNHDDPTRLTAGLPLAASHNIAIVGGLEKLKEKSFNQNSPVKVIETGKGHIKIKKNEEIACIAYLPYPSDSRIFVKLDGEDLSYVEKVKGWSEISAGAFDDNELNIFVSHLFLVGAETATGKVKVGDALAVPKNYLPKADYTALGHLHSPQNLGGNVYYSGAISELTPKQKNLGVNIFESSGGKVVEVQSIKLKNVARYEKVVVNSLEEAEEKLAEFDDGDLVELEFHVSAPLSASALKQLRKDFACVSNVSLVMSAEMVFAEEKNASRKLLSDEQLFRQFYLQTRGVEASNDLIQMFLECRGDRDETENS